MGRGTGGSNACADLLGEARRITLVALLEHGFVSIDRSMVSIMGDDWIDNFSRDVDGRSLNDSVIFMGLTVVSDGICNFKCGRLILLLKFKLLATYVIYVRRPSFTT